MASIIIAGRPNSEDTSECILLINNIQAKIPNVNYIKVLKHPEEWEDYAEEVCNLFGFHKVTHPLIFYSNGRFIGGKDDFFKHVKTNFQTELLSEQGKLMIESRIIKSLTEENINKTNVEYFERKTGAEVDDIINQKMEELTSKDIEVESNNRYNTLESKYDVEFLGEMKVFYKYNIKFGAEEGEYIEYPDPLEEGVIELDMKSRKATIDMGNSTIENNLNNNSSHLITSQNASHLATENKLQIDVEDEEYEEGEENSKIMPKKKEIKYKYYKTFETPAHLLKNSDKFMVNKNYGIGYKIVLNPYFYFYGESLLFNPDKNLQTENSLELIIADYGKLPSLRKIAYEESVLHLIKTQISLPEDKISSLQTNIYSNNFLSENDIFYMVEAVKDIQGMATLRVLPYKYSDYKHFGSSMIKLLKLPLKDIQYEDVPLNKKVEQTIRQIKRAKIKKMIEKSGKETEGEKKIDVLLDNEELTHYFDLKECFTIETYNAIGVKHLVKSYTWHNFKLSDVKKDISNMLRDLNITLDSGLGFNLIMTKNYIFIAPLVNPYVMDKNNVPIFADPHYFAGIFTFPLIEAEWPETVKGEYMHFEPSEVLNKSTNI